MTLLGAYRLPLLLSQNTQAGMRSRRLQKPLHRPFHLTGNGRINTASVTSVGCYRVAGRAEKGRSRIIKGMSFAQDTSPKNAIKWYVDTASPDHP
jgi:hypothetical protein